MGKTDETKFSQQDFSGGFNSNPRINNNELQLCENLDLKGAYVLPFIFNSFDNSVRLISFLTII